MYPLSSALSPLSFHFFCYIRKLTQIRIKFLFLLRYFFFFCRRKFDVTKGKQQKKKKFHKSMCRRTCICRKKEFLLSSQLFRELVTCKMPHGDQKLKKHKHLLPQPTRDQLVNPQGILFRELMQKTRSFRLNGILQQIKWTESEITGS